MTFAAVAAEIGLSKGRIAQIRQSAPPAERALFGVGPLTVAVPLRAMPNRSLPVISAEDSIASERLTSQLLGLGFVVEQFRIPTDGLWTPPAEAIAICGPKNSKVTADALDADPHLEFRGDASGRYGITDRATGERYLSGMDDDPPTPGDVAYVGRLPYRGGTLFVIAGVHAIGSVGAVHYLAGHAAEIYEAVGDGLSSAVIASTHDGDTITHSEVACPLGATDHHHRGNPRRRPQTQPGPHRRHRPRRRGVGRCELVVAAGARPGRRLVRAEPRRVADDAPPGRLPRLGGHRGGGDRRDARPLPAGAGGEP